MNNTETIFELKIDETTKNNFKAVSLWAKINAVVAFISIGISIATIILTAGMIGADAAGSLFGQQFIAMSISILLNVVLLSAAKNIQKAVSFTDQGAFNKGLGELARYLKIIGILFIVASILVIIIFLFLLLVGGFGRG